MGYARTNIAATTAAVVDRIVASATMKNTTTYTIANASPVWAGGALITVTHSQVGGVTATLGPITIAGTDVSGQAISEVIVPLTGTTATGTKIFRTVTSAIGAGWARNAGAGSEDTITIGVAAGAYVATGGGQLGGVLVNNSVAATIVVSDAAGTIMTVPASQAAGTYYPLNGVDWSGYLKVATTNTNDVTLIHTSAIPTVYAA